MPFYTETTRILKLLPGKSEVSSAPIYFPVIRNPHLQRENKVQETTGCLFLDKTVAHIEEDAKKCLG